MVCRKRPMVNPVSPGTYTSPPLAGGDKGEGDIIDWKLILFTLTPTLSRQGRGRF
jgi:hypothetical protein